MKAMLGRFQLFSIKHKLLASFCVILAILTLVVSLTFFNIRDTQMKVADVTQKIQPVVLASTELRSGLKQASTAMGFYLLTREKLHKQQYLDLLKHLDHDMAKLQETIQVVGDMNSNDLFVAVQRDVNKFKNYEQRLIELAEDFDKNYKAVGFASAELSPINQEMLEIMSNMMVSERDQDLDEERRSVLFAVQELRYSWASVMNFARVFLLYGTPSALDNAKTYLEKSKSLLDEISSQPDLLTFEEEGSLPRLIELHNIWRENFKQMITIRQSDEARVDGHLIRTEIGPLLSEIDNNLNNLVNRKIEQITRTSQELMEKTNSTSRLVIILLAIGLFIGGTVSVIMTRLITRPIDVTADAMTDIAKGDGDLTRRLKETGNDELTRLSSGFNAFVENIHDLVTGVSGASSKLSSAAGDMSNVTTQMEHAIHEQNVQSEQIETSAREMAVSTEQISQSATKTSEAMKIVDSETTEGKKTIGNALQAINKLGDETNTAADLVRELGEGIKGIDAIIDLIIGISEQTNLLALNASIEAARAGEQGRGFAVVADEVRTLANRTRESTKEIQDAVETLLASAENTVIVMSNNSQAAQNAMTLAANASESLDRITTSVSQGTKEALEIASATEQLYRMSVEITELIKSIVEISYSTSKVSEQVTTTSNELSYLSDQLQNNTARFKV